MSRAAAQRYDVFVATMKTPPVSGRRSLCVDRKNGAVNVLLSGRKGTRLQGQKGSRAVGDGVPGVPRKGGDNRTETTGESRKR